MLCAMLGVGVALGQPASPIVADSATPRVLDLDAAVSWRWRYNPEIAVQRQQRGIAAAKVLIANAYPFNPVMENRIQGAAGPASAGITNSVPLEHLILWEMEVRGQGKLRRQSAAAGLSRTDWEIVREEQLLIARVLAAFSTWLYRDQKLRLFLETQRFNEQLAIDVGDLMKAGKLHANDLILAQTEAQGARDFVESAREVQVACALRCLPRARPGKRHFCARRHVERTPPGADAASARGDRAPKPRRFVGEAGRHRRSRSELAANARESLWQSDGRACLRLRSDTRELRRHPTQRALAGRQLAPGRSRPARRRTGAGAVGRRSTEMLVRQNVQSAIARLEAAQRREEIYRTAILPGLVKADEDMEKLFRAALGVDVLRVLDVRRKLLTARDSYLDTLWRVTQVRAELVAAVGVLGLPGWNPVLGRP